MGVKVINLDNNDFDTLAVCALRYCQGRRTYMPDMVREIIRPHLKELQDRTLCVLENDCAFQSQVGLFGDEKIDKPGWIQWRNEIEAEIRRRQAEQ